MTCKIPYWVIEWWHSQGLPKNHLPHNLLHIVGQYDPQTRIKKNFNCSPNSVEEEKSDFFMTFKIETQFL
jgi:hypothetical protein